LTGATMMVRALPVNLPSLDDGERRSGQEMLLRSPRKAWTLSPHP
jgi:hypothetical protein